MIGIGFIFKTRVISRQCQHIMSNIIFSFLLIVIVVFVFVYVTQEQNKYDVMRALAKRYGLSLRTEGGRFSLFGGVFGRGFSLKTDRAVDDIGHTNRVMYLTVDVNLPRPVYLHLKPKRQLYSEWSVDQKELSALKDAFQIDGRPYELLEGFVCRPGQFPHKLTHTIQHLGRPATPTIEVVSGHICLKHSNLHLTENQLVYLIERLVNFAEALENHIPPTIP